jgi:hypothetical protein
VIFRPQLAKGVMVANPGNETVVTRGTKFTHPELPDRVRRAAQVPRDGLRRDHAVGQLHLAGHAQPARRRDAQDADDRAAPDRRHEQHRQPLGLRVPHVDDVLVQGRPAADVRLRGRRAADPDERAHRAQNFPTIEIPPSALATAYIDSTWANLGVTQILSQILSAEVKFSTGLKPKLSLDGRTDLDFTTHILDASAVNVEATIRMLVEASAGQFATEKTAAEAATLRALRLKILGTSSREIDIDSC